MGCQCGCNVFFQQTSTGKEYCESCKTEKTEKSTGCQGCDKKNKTIEICLKQLDIIQDNLHSLREEMTKIWEN